MLPAQRSAPLDIHRLINRLVTDPHGLILWIVNLEAVRDLLWAPGRRPPAALTVNRSPLLPRHYRAVESETTSIGDFTSQTLLNILAEDRLLANLHPRGRRAARSACHCAVLGR